MPPRIVDEKPGEEGLFSSFAGILEASADLVEDLTGKPAPKMRMNAERARKAHVAAEKIARTGARVVDTYEKAKPAAQALGKKLGVVADKIKKSGAFKWEKY